MIDLKPTVLAALRGNAALVTLLGGPKIWPETTSNEDDFPYITFFEITNFEARHADDSELQSEIHFQVDVWSKGNTGPAAVEIARTMADLGFRRTAAVDQYEKETKTYHKVLRFKKIAEV